MESCWFLEEQAQEKFDRDGYVISQTVLHESAIRLFEKAYEESATLYDHPRYISTLEIGDLEHRKKVHNLFKALVTPYLEEMLNSYVQYYAGYGVKKATGDRCILDLHQDITMVPFDGPRSSITVWVPLIDTDEGNGCLQVFSGSHKMNRHPRAPLAPFPYESFREDICLKYLESVPLQRGQLIFMDQALLHRSGPNNTELTRVAIMAMLRPVSVPLVCYHRVSDGQDILLEQFSVPDDYYLHARLGERPCGPGIVRLYDPKRIFRAIYSAQYDVGWRPRVTDLATTQQIVDVIQSELLSRNLSSVVHPDTSLLDTGLSSFDIVRIVLRLEEHFGLTFNDGHINPTTFGTPLAISALISSLK